MKIGIIIGRIGGIDGVALETEKWIAVLERMGHEVNVLAGELEGPLSQVTVLPELAFSHANALRHQELAFLGHGERDVSEEELLADLESGAELISDELERWLEAKNIDLLISENASAIPLHLTMGMAIKNVVERSGIPTVTHDHDFAWERGDRYASAFESVNEIVSSCFPITLPNVRHAVINSAARDALSDRYGTAGTVVVPNVMDFDSPVGIADDYNRRLREDLGVQTDDTLLFQVTRIVRRKGIEIAIDLVHRLRDSQVKLVITGTSVDDQFDGYTEELQRQVARLGVEAQVLFAGDRFDASRRTTPEGARLYSLWDGYANATACTYFSLYEGFGNAFVEAVVARVPIFVNNYEPVYWPDIGSKGFRTVMLEQGELTDDAVAEVREVLRNPTLRRDVTEHNFELGRRYFSYQALETLLEELLDKAT
jgi:glycosyltransferase involved in cell wall biosynthesis